MFIVDVGSSSSNFNNSHAPENGWKGEHENTACMLPLSSEIMYALLYSPRNDTSPRMSYPFGDYFGVKRGFQENPRNGKK